MSKPRKRKPTTGRRPRDHFGPSASLATATLARANGLLLPTDRIRDMSIAMLSALDTLRSDFDASAFRALMHWHRVGRWICERFDGTQGVEQSLAAADQALHDHGAHDDRRQLTPDQYKALRRFVLAMIDAAHWTTVRHMDEAEDYSRTLFKRAYGRRYMEAPEWQHDAMRAVMRGTSLPAAAERFAKRAAEVREACIDMAMIGHSIMMDSTTPPPDTIPAARAMWPRIEAVFKKLDAAAIATVNELDRRNYGEAARQFERACARAA